MKDFFEFIFDGGEGLVCITRTDYKGDPTRNKFFSYPSELDEMVTFCIKFSHESLYFVPNLLSEEHRRNSAVSYGTCAHAEADLFPLEDFKVAPSLVVHTSPGKTHTYWKIENSTDPVEIERLSKAVVLTHPKVETGLDQGYSRSKLLRVPGTTNLKYEEPYKVNYEIIGTTYTVEEFAEKYPLPEAGAVVDSKLPENLPTREEAMQMINWTQEIDDILTNNYRKDTGRFRALALATHEIFRAGGSNEVAFALLQGTELNKWAADGISNASQRLWEDIQRSRSQSELVAPEDAAPLAVPTVQASKYKRVNFLSEEEQKLVKPTFVDEFVAWGQSKTKTSPVFHTAAGFTILSTIFADFWHIQLEWGKEPLNLWFMPTGQSTVDRKTTVLNQMLSVLRDLDREGAYDYDIGSDFTVSGLSDMLLDSPNRSGLVHIDEFQGFLEELGKNYMAGTKGALTAMYGGFIKGKLRSTSTVKRKAGVNYALNFYAMGITKQVAAALNREDFLSGFLTRFIYVSPPEDYVPPEITEGFNLAPRNQAKHGDPVYEAMVNKLRTARTYYDTFLDPTTPTEPIDVSQEAHDRIAQFLQDMAENVRSEGKEELLSTAMRLSISVYKCAALLAIVECGENGSVEVKLEHVLCAINFANDWYMNILRMVDMISDSDWMKVQDEIIGVLAANGNSMDAKVLYRSFKDKHKPREYAEIIKALDESGVIQQVTAGKKVTVNYVGGTNV